MMCISSPAGRRLAVAKAAMDAAEQAMHTADRVSDDSSMRARGLYASSHAVFCREARAVADELIAQGFADMDEED